ncbi:hypothetical protein IFR04_005626 [Cadophora malorum]|uniref:Protein kinase domain-containing protein n=1 Tax=Cadophora malorum TaxID=108018 RepID=A0A8H7TGH3_9HELO|nr:hypothetical protein IFR04_005626 [Cadophora malorum]
MAEVFGIVTAVLGLLPLCRGMIKDVFDSARTLELAVGRLELQQDRFDEWRDIWQDEDGEPDMKFEAYAKANPAAGKRVLRQLALMSQALCDAHALEDKYGIKPSHWPDRESKDLSRFRLREGENLTLETQGIFVERCKMNMSFIKRCKFVFRKKDAVWTSLIDLIKEYNENLATYGPKFDLERMLKGEFDILRKMQLAELKRRAEAASYEARHSLPDGNNVARYQDMSLAAQFSSVVKYERKHAAYKFTMRDFRLDPSYAVSSSGSSTMALLFDYPVRKENRVVLIEWIDNLDRDQERDTRIKTLMLATPKPDRLLLPKCYGMVEDPIARRYGLVLAPPSHIRSNLPQILPAGAISQKRMPVSLTELLEKRHPANQEILDLGIRFRLAKKLVEAVNMMHCVGWVHKNIRSNSILFFPAANIPSHGPPGPASGIPQPLGFDNPLFVGLGNARMDDLISDPDPYYPSEHEPIYVSEHGQRLIRIHSPHHGPGNEISMTRRPKDINLDYYQHPDKRWNPSIRYSRAHDFYSLGCVLLEIGLWEPLHEVVDVEDEDFERVKRGFQSLTLRLDGLAGSIYGGVVRKCLAVGTRERSEAEGKELSRFFAGVAAELDKCWA